MGKKKAPKWHYKYVTPEKFNEYEEMSEEELIETLKNQSAYHQECVNEKKFSDLFKELKSEINEYKKKWEEENPSKVEEIASLRDQIKAIQEERDEKIESDIEEKKELEAGFRDAINGAQEHINVIVDLLRKKS